MAIYTHSFLPSHTCINTYTQIHRQTDAHIGMLVNNCYIIRNNIFFYYKLISRDKNQNNQIWSNTRMIVRCREIL